jgi:predicted metal-binding membrane protein
MLSMFAFGLMNILAMGVLTVIMFMETTSFSRIKLAKIWGGVAFALSALFYVQSV